MRGGKTKDMMIKTSLDGPVDFAKTLKLSFRVRDLDQPAIKKKELCQKAGRGGSRRTELPLCNLDESRTHRMGKCELYKGRECVRAKRKKDRCDIETFGTLDSSEKTITTLPRR